MTANGVTLGVRAPAGWQSMANEHGILLAEHAELYETDSPNGIYVGVFIPDIHDMNLAPLEGENLAWTVLDHITNTPAYLGNATVSEALPLEVGGHEAAYYLLSDDDGNRTLVLALSVPSQDKLVVCNISSGLRDARRIRDVLPVVLANITINGTPVPSDDLAALPNPLEFPPHQSPADEPIPVSTADR